MNCDMPKSSATDVKNSTQELPIPIKRGKTGKIVKKKILTPKRIPSLAEEPVRELVKSSIYGSGLAEKSRNKH